MSYNGGGGGVPIGGGFWILGSLVVAASPRTDLNEEGAWF
jgi:hypothetical protein